MVALTHWVCFLKRAAVDTALHLSVFRRLVRLDSFLGCWRQAIVTLIPKGPPSSSVANYQPFSITSVLSKVFERLVSVHLGRFIFIYLSTVVCLKPRSLLSERSGYL